MFLRRRFLCLASALVLAFTTVLSHAQAYTSVVVFGDSLSDTGNVAHLTESKYTAASRVPGKVADYTDGRFTDGTDTVPAARTYTGVWIEQLAATFPAKPAVKNSLDGGTDYAYGLAGTADGTSAFTFGPANSLSVNVNNMGQQVTDYLATSPAISNKTLFVVWGGANDLISATSSADVTNAANREVALIQRLIAAGATDFIVPNLPPLGAVPRFNGSTSTSFSATQSAMAFNQALSAGLAGLPAANPGKTLRIFPLDVFTIFNGVIGPPISGGLTNVTSSSQGSATVNPDTYLFWDDLHPTTTGHHLLAAAATTLVTPVATTTTVASSALNANLSSSVTFTATVTAGSGAPTGTVTFLDGTTALGTGTLTAAGATSSTATFSTSSLSAGTHTITASYGGGGNFAGSTSAAITQTITAPALQSALSPTSITIPRGSTGTATVTMTPVGGFSGTVTLACGSLPMHLSCTFAPASVTFSGGASAAQTSTLTVGTRSSAAMQMPAMPGEGTAVRIFSAFAIVPWMGFAGVAAAGRRRGRRNVPLLIVLAVLSMGAAVGMTGCGGSDNRAAAGTYTVPVNVTAGSSTSSLSLTVVVQ